MSGKQQKEGARQWLTANRSVLFNRYIPRDQVSGISMAQKISKETEGEVLMVAHKRKLAVTSRVGRRRGECGILSR